MTAAVPLADLAAIWVERWLTYGGGLIANSETAGLSISMRMDQWRWRHGEAYQRHWHDGWMTGRWRELQEIIELVPGLQAAIVEHVARHGIDAGPNRKQMERTGAHVAWQAKSDDEREAET